MKFLEITLDKGTILYLAIDSIQKVEIKQDKLIATIFMKVGTDSITLSVPVNVKALQDKLSRISF